MKVTGDLILKIKEKMWLEKINRGDDEAFGNAYDFYAPKIFRHVYFRVSSRELAEDITSQVFLKTWEYLANSGRKIENLKYFLYRIAHNQIIDYYRKKDKLPILIDEGFENKAFHERDIIKEINDQEELKLVRKNLSKLKKDYREVLVSRYLDDLSIEEISEITQKSKNAVYILISRAIKELKEHINTN